MRERERLDDFRGGHVACRGCRRLMFFESGITKAVVCCGYAYMPTQHQIDLVIYDRVQPGEVPDAVRMPTPEPVVVDEYGEPDPEELYESLPGEEAEADAMVATAEQIEANKEVREAELKRRGR